MSEFFGLFATFAQLITIMWLANVAEGRRERGDSYQNLTLLTYVAAGSILAAMFFVGLVLQFVGLALSDQPELLDVFSAAPVAPAIIEQILTNPMLAIGIWAPALLGILLLTPPLRRLCAHVLPIDPASPVHAVSLAFMMLVLVNMLVTLNVGLDQVAELLADQEEAGEGSNITTSLLWGQQILMALMALVGVGWLSRRSLRQVLLRLGLVRPSGRDVLIGLAAALIMVPVSALVQRLATLLGFGIDPSVEQLTEQLIGDLFTTPWGILTLGLAAAIGKEPLFRGAMQPRFGLVLTSVLFAVVHSNYGVSASTVLVLVLGLMLGWLRIRYNTTTSMIAHATYNGVIGLMAYLALQFIEF